MHIGFICHSKEGTISPSDHLYCKALLAEGATVETVSWRATSPEALSSFDGCVVRSIAANDQEYVAFASWISRARMSGVTFANPSNVILWSQNRFAHGGLPNLGNDFLAGHACKNLPGWHTASLVSSHKAKKIQCAMHSVTCRAGSSQLLGQDVIDYSLDVPGCVISSASNENHTVRAQSFFWVNETCTHSVIASGTGQLSWQRTSMPDNAKAIVTELLEWIGQPVLYMKINGFSDGNHFLCTGLELCEPDLFLHHAIDAAEKFASSTLTYFNDT